MDKKIFLLDANVLIDYYISKQRNHKEVFEAINFLKQQRNLNKCLLFIPNFCIGEIISTFARFCFYDGDVKINKDEFNKAKWNFLDDVSRDYEYKRYQCFYHEELNRYHLLHAHLVYQPVWEYLNEAHRKGNHLKKDGTKKFLSAFDILVIAQGIEMTNFYSEKDFSILTSDLLIYSLCGELKKKSNKERESFIKRYGQQGNSDNLISFKYPNCILAKNIQEIMKYFTP